MARDGLYYGPWGSATIKHLDYHDDDDEFIKEFDSFDKAKTAIKKYYGINGVNAIETPGWKQV